MRKFWFAFFEHKAELYGKIPYIHVFVNSNALCLFVREPISSVRLRYTHVNQIVKNITYFLCLVRKRHVKSSLAFAFSSISRSMGN